MLVSEWEESFEHEGLSFKGIWTEFDSKSLAGDSNIITRVIRILVEDEVAHRIPPGSLIIRIATGERYRLKTRMLSGIGITEIDLEKDRATSYEGEF